MTTHESTDQASYDEIGKYLDNPPILKVSESFKSNIEVNDDKSLCQSIWFMDETAKKLERFVLNLDGEDGSSLHFVILGGNFVLMTIERTIFDNSNYRYEDDDYHREKLLFTIREYQSSSRHGGLEYFENTMNLESCLREIKRLVSPSGVIAIEDPTREALSVCNTVGVHKWFSLTFKNDPVGKREHVNLDQLRANIINQIKGALDKSGDPGQRLDYFPFSNNDENHDYSLTQVIRLDDQGKKLRDFVQDLNAKDGESLHYVTFSADCILITITRSIDSNSREKLFTIREFYPSLRDGGLGYFENIMNSESCLEEIKRFVRYCGDIAFEDPTHEALLVCNDIGVYKWPSGKNPARKHVNLAKLRSDMFYRIKCALEQSKDPILRACLNEFPFGNMRLMDYGLWSTPKKIKKVCKCCKPQIGN